MGRLIIIALIISIIPVGGFWVGKYIELNYENQWSDALIENMGAEGTELVESKRFTLRIVCSDSEMKESLGMDCTWFDNNILFKTGSLWTGGAGLALLLFIFIGARVASASRRLLLWLFAPGIKMVLFSLFLLMIVQGAIAAYSAYMLEAMLVERVHYYIVGSIVIGALVAAFVMLTNGLSVSKRAEVSVLGKTLSRSEHPGLFQLVGDVMEELKALPPKNIVVGLEPNFFVTSAKLKLIGENVSYRDRSLYLSLPFMRILSRDELAAVVGHELGHFKGEDTKFSMKFYPIYVGTSQALEALSNMEHRGASFIASIPARAILSFFLNEFAQAERKIGRQRELEADKAGASAASARDLATALLKIGAFIPAWDVAHESIIEAINKEKPIRNVSTVISEVAETSANPNLLDDISDFKISHPIDTHPTTFERLKALDIELSEIKEQALTIVPESSAINLVNKPEHLEEEISVQHQEQLAFSIDKALMPYKEAIQQEPDNAQTHYALGLAYMELGRFEHAIGSFREAKRLWPEVAEFYVDLGAAYMEMGRFEDAAVIYREAIERWPELDELHYCLGSAYLEAGNREGAMREHGILKDMNSDLAEPLAALIEGD